MASLFIYGYPPAAVEQYLKKIKNKKLEQVKTTS